MWKIPGGCAACAVRLNPLVWLKAERNLLMTSGIPADSFRRPCDTEQWDFSIFNHFIEMELKNPCALCAACAKFQQDVFAGQRENPFVFDYWIISEREENVMGYARKKSEEAKLEEKKFVRYKEGAEKYSLGLTKFQQLAREAGATYKIDKVVLVNCEIFERYLETFREVTRP